jgi:beta-lactamase class D
MRRALLSLLPEAARLPRKSISSFEVSHMLRQVVWWIGVVFLCVEARAQGYAPLQKTLQGLDAAVAVIDTRTGAFLRLNEARLSQSFPPFATLEVPVALAALETRTIRNLNDVTPWNRLKYPLAENAPLNWNTDHTLRSAFTHSVAWYWQDLSERIGVPRLSSALHKFSFGSGTADFQLPHSWQDGAWQISAQEQTQFLTRLANGTLLASKSRQREIKALMLRESGAGYRLYLKTSVGFLRSGYYLGWSIGWLETAESNYVFALNLTHRDFEFTNEAVSQLPKKILVAAGYWEIAE